MLRLVQGGGIIDAWAPLLTGTGVDHQVRRADQPVRYGGCGLDRQPCFYQWRIQTAVKLGEDFREHEMLPGSIYLDLGDPTGIHHR